MPRSTRSRHGSRRKHIVGTVGAGVNFIKYNWVRPLRARPFYPRALCLFVTYRCNLRCRMCGIWNSDKGPASSELTVEEIEQVLSDPLFRKLEFINLNGGEPNLREDLVEIAGLAISGSQKLKALSLNSNGFPPHKTIENVQRIMELCRKNGIRFSVSLSLHRIGQEYDAVSGVVDSFAKVMQAFRGLKELQRGGGIHLSANCVVTRMNVRSLDELLDWSEREEIPVNFVQGEIRDRFHNDGMSEDVCLDESEEMELALFFRKLAKDQKRFRQHSLRYAHLADRLESARRRRLSCYYSLGGVVLGSEGDLSYCPHSKTIGNCRNSSAADIYFSRDNLEYRRETLLNDKCRTCPPYNFNRMEVEKDILRLVKYSIFGRS